MDFLSTCPYQRSVGRGLILRPELPAINPFVNSRPSPSIREIDTWPWCTFCRCRWFGRRYAPTHIYRGLLHKPSSSVSPRQGDIAYKAVCLTPGIDQCVDKLCIQSKMKGRLWFSLCWSHVRRLFVIRKVNMGPAQISQTFWFKGSTSTYFR